METRRLKNKASAALLAANKSRTFALALSTLKNKTLATNIPLEPWQVKILRAIKIVGAPVKVIAADKTDFTVYIKGTTVTPITLLSFLNQQSIVTAAYPESSTVVKVVYSRLDRSASPVSR